MLISGTVVYKNGQQCPVDAVSIWERGADLAAKFASE